MEELPSSFVLKTTHGGDNKGVIVVKEKAKVDKKKIMVRLSKAMKQNLYATSKEWPYKNVTHRIIAEKYMEDDVAKELRDYKFFCFDGKVKAMFVASSRQKNAHPYFDYFDENGEWINLRQSYENNPCRPTLPNGFREMVKIAETLSKGIPHVRVDLYFVNGLIYFGEFTFFHFGGFSGFRPAEWDRTFGDMISLPPKMI